jgi:hypothetical protein
VSGIRIEQRFSECQECVHFDPTRLVQPCLGCKAGENFDPKIDDEEPSEATLLGMLKDWTRDDC